MPVAAPMSGYAARRGTPAAPTVRATFGGSVASGTSANATLPAGIANGDVGVIVACTAQTATINTPAGWTLMDQRNDSGSSGSTINVAVFKKKLTTGDSSTVVTVGRSTGSDTIIISGIVFTGAEDATALRLGRDPVVTNPNGQTVRIPATYPDPSDLAVAVGGARGFASLALSAPQVTTQPTGFTARENRSNQNGGLTFAFGAFISTAPASSANGVSKTALLGDQCQRLGGMFTITPAGRRPASKLPAGLLNAAIHGYGTSYLGVAVDGYAHASEAVYYDRIARAMGTPSADNNMGLPGALCSDIVGGAFGSVAYWTRSVGTDANFAVQQAQTWMSQTGRSGLVLCSLFENDGLNHAATVNGGTTAKSLAGARNAGEALVRLLRASSVVQDTHASVTYGGTWTANTGISDNSAGTNHQTITPGSTVTITGTIPDLDLILLAIDDSAAGIAGAPFEVRVDGVLVKSGTCSNQMRKSTASAYNQAPYCQMPVALRNLGGGSHTIELKHVGSSGTLLTFEDYLLPAATPPVIVLNKLPTYSSAALAALPNPSSNAIMAQYSQIAQDIADLFPDGRVLTFDPLESGLWDFTTMVTSYDNVHLTETGQAFYARGITKLLNERVA